MAFGKLTVPAQVTEIAYIGPGTIEVRKLEAAMLGGIALLCGCIVKDRWRGTIIRPCLRHNQQEAVNQAQPMTSNFQGECRSCRRRIRIGDPIFWEKLVGAWHATCDAPASAKEKAG